MAVTPPQIPDVEMRVLVPVELDALARSIEDPDRRCLVELGAMTGCRLGELLAAQWSDVDDAEGRLRIERSVSYTPGRGPYFKQPKTDASRRDLGLPERAVMLLRRHRTAQLERRIESADVWHDNDLIFPDAVGRLVAPYTVSTWFRKEAKAAGFEGFTFHELRHSHATLLLTGGIPDKLAASRLGHKNANVTRSIYQHIIPDHDDRVVEVLNQLLAGGE